MARQHIHERCNETFPGERYFQTFQSLKQKAEERCVSSVGALTEKLSFRRL